MQHEAELVPLISDRINSWGSPARHTQWDRRCRGCFGGGLETLCDLWHVLLANGCKSEKLTATRMLYGLHFLSVYGTESNAAIFFGVSEKTYRVWARVAVDSIANLKLISIFFVSSFVSSCLADSLFKPPHQLATAISTNLCGWCDLSSSRGGSPSQPSRL